MKNDSDPHCNCAFAALVLVALTRLEIAMGTVADAWKSVKKELADLKAQNAALQDQVKNQQPLDDSDQAALVEMEAEAAAANPPVATESAAAPVVDAAPDAEAAPVQTS